MVEPFDIFAAVRPVGRPGVFTLASIVVGAVVAVGVAAEAVAQNDELELTWSSLPETAAAVYDAGPGRAREQLVAGWQGAAETVPGRWRGWSLEYAPDISLLDRDVAPHEHSVTTWLTLELGDRPGLERAAYEAEAERSRAGYRADRWSYVTTAASLWLDWWVARATADHLAEYADTFAGYLEPIRSAVEARTMSLLTLRDLEAELARLRAEVVAAERQAGGARAALSALLGQRVEPVDDLGVELHELELSQLELNPWRPLHMRLDDFPELRVLEREAAARRAEAELAESRAPWALAFGLGTRSAGDNALWLSGLVGLEVPLSNPSGPERARQLAEATRLERELEWRRRELSASLDADAARYDDLLTSYAALRDTLEGPLAERAELVERGLSTGTVTLDQVIRARRDLHEARHELLVLTGELLLHRERAAALQRLFDEGA